MSLVITEIRTSRPGMSYKPRKGTNMKFLSVLLLAGLSIFNIQCSKSGGGSKPSRTYYVNGDPKSFIVGTTMKSDLKLENIADFNELYFDDSIDLLEVSPTESKDEMVEDQKGKSAEESSADMEDITFDDNQKYKFTNESGKYIYSSKDQSVILRFVNQGGTLRVESVKDKLGDRVVHPYLQHISIAKDKSMVSVLVYDKDSSRKSLSVYFFAKKHDNQLDLAQGDYDFLAGKNIKIRWEQDISLNICSTSLKPYESKIKELFRKWTDNISSVRFNMKVLNNPPPFSDLNTQCIYVFENYFTNDPRGEGFTLGLTFTSGTTKFIDSDIFLFETSLSYADASIVEGRNMDTVFETIVHEMGHFLGLGHPENLYAPEHRTIMSYQEYGSYDLFWHDIESIRALYE